MTNLAIYAASVPLAKLYDLTWKLLFKLGRCLSEVWKALGVHGVKWLTRLLNTVKEKKEESQMRGGGVLSFQYSSERGTRRSVPTTGIRLTAHTMKPCERLVDSGLRELIAISQEQFGFMPERPTMDTIFVARPVMENNREKRRPCYLALLDLEKALDRLPRRVLWRALRKRKVPEWTLAEREENQVPQLRGGQGVNS
ncbi:hypothetical protein V3C99_004815 [Haemonchus contortus]|uniref:Reverse transcriptase domain-containing protein n=1 Tax=Haemonchus contortus TaxID=6289 RepID=A0A7I4XVY4_HAECO